MPFVRTPQTAPLNTFVRTDASDINTNYLSFLPSPQEKKKLFGGPATWTTPNSFDGKVQWKSYLSAVRNQGSCGGCYAFASTSALADCFNLRSLGELHLNLSAARIIMCDLLGQYTNLVLPSSSSTVKQIYNIYGCQGNTLMESWLFLYNFGTNTETCFPDDTLGKKDCSTVSSLQFDECLDGSPAVFYKAQHVYAVAGIPADGGSEQEIRKIIYKFGPVSAAMTIYEDFYTFDTRQIYIRNPSAKRISGHSVVLDGWGEENGTPFWWVRNSWGTDWGINGYFKILRGSNHCEIEENVIAGLPDVVGTISRYFQSIPFQETSGVSVLNQRIVRSPYTSYGGLDEKTGISRRLLSYDAYSHWPAKLKVDIDPETYFAGELGTSAQPSYLWLIISIICLALIVFVTYLIL